ncbi:MAG TPA: hypothetical protein PKD99_08665 [Sphingopyxis sp.]|nr:hypothetical protein [Sphingopyxis sp.]HMP45162.1 hypothetical protein [Sphingopyxis sp.]
MMNIDRSEPPSGPASPCRNTATAPRRATPCTGLFGWRKDAGPPPKSKDKDKE